jgi:branched-chain amino acid transport system ATP-binding protein
MKKGGAMSEIIIEAVKVSKNFGGLKAVNEVDLQIKKGQIYSIIGPNGAGKTTFFNCVSGFYTPETGDILYYGTPIQGNPTNFIASIGISRTYQNVRLFGTLTAMENVLIGLHNKLNSNWLDALIHSPRFTRENTWSLQEAYRLLDFVGLKGYGDFLASNMPYGMQRRLEIARALANNPRLLLLDEPTAGMNIQETTDITQFIKRLRDELDITILLIEHDMKVVMDISDRIRFWTMAQRLPKAHRKKSRVING